MATTLTSPRSLEEFLALPEEKPALEFFDNQIYPQPMAKRRHSILQFEISSAINQIAKPAKTFPELRCTFSGCSIVPDIAVLLWEHIKFAGDGEARDDVLIPPDWMIEIFSPEQNSGWLIRKITRGTASLVCGSRGSLGGCLLFRSLAQKCTGIRAVASVVWDPLVDQFQSTV